MFIVLTLTFLLISDGLCQNISHRCILRDKDLHCYFLRYVLKCLLQFQDVQLATKKIIRLSSLCPFFDQLQTKHSIKNLCLLTALCSTMSTNQCQLLLSHHFEEAKSHKPQQSRRRKLFSQSLLKYCAERKSIYEMYIFL